MFGKKKDRAARLAAIGALLRSEGDSISQAELARRLGVSRATILKDLAVLQERTGILVAEDGHGRLSLFRGG